MTVVLAVALWSHEGLLAPERHYGVSAEADVFRRCADEVRQHNLESLTIRHTPVTALAALEEARSVAANDNWDGFGAQRLDAESYRHAIDFLRALPISVPVPDVAVDPDGEVSVEWSLGRRCILTVSVGPGGRLSYSAIIGLTKIRGIEWLVDGVPRPIADTLGRVVAAADVPAATAPGW